MDSSSRPTTRPLSYDDFDPVFEWEREEGLDTIRIYLPGFKRDHVRVQVDNLGNLTASGERPIDGTRRSRFRKEFRIPEGCNVDDIHAMFENEVLKVLLPKAKAPIPAPTAVPTPKLAPETGAGVVVPAGEAPAPMPAVAPRPTAVPPPKPAPETDAGVVVPAGETAAKQADAKGSESTGARAPGETATKQAGGEEGEKVLEKEKKRTVADGKAAGDEKPVTSERPGDETGAETKPGPQQLLVNVAVAVGVLMGLAMFATYKLAKTT